MTHMSVLYSQGIFLETQIAPYYWSKLGERLSGLEVGTRECKFPAEG
jgi:hypothetical protein